ncbi:MAG: hypothetical protein K2K13_01085 [Clostridiales bacterium]|nr:hypothetical protein [Clostridiales bacterium]
MKKLRKILLIVFVVSALALAFVACSETTDTEHNHRWGEWSADTATCTQGGTQTRTCTSEGCKGQDGKPATETRTTKALGHNVTSWTLCESDHSKHEGVCSRTDCGVTVTQAHNANAAGTECVDCGAALGSSEQCLHPNASATSTTAATCTSAKIEHWTCPDCDWTDDRTVGTPWGHDYTDVAWTPIVGGKHERECARDCGDKQTDTCNSNGVITGTAATCEGAGRENGTKCSVCGGNETLGKVINPLGHEWGEWSADTATCTEGGTQERTCTRNGCDTNDGQAAVDTRTTEALGHEWGEWSADTATCTEGGEQTRTCTRDDCDTNDGQAAVDTRTTEALGHEWGEWGADTATCTEGGTQERTCTRNGCDTNDGQAAVDTRTTNALGHDEYKVDETAATCTANKVEHMACHRCDWTDDKEIADTALGHDYTDVAWTFVAGGTHERECARDCGDKQTGTCDDDGVIDGTAATCTAAGRENGTKCSVCGGNEVLGAVINALGHGLTVDSVTDATCTAAKVNHMACGRCDYTEDQNEGEALGHEFTGASAVVPDDETYHATECSRCDALDLDNKHAAEWDEYGLTADETQHYQTCKHCNVQSAPADHSATTYTYASNGAHSGECVCGKELTEKCELQGGANACSGCGRIIGSVSGVSDFTVDFSTYGSVTIDPMTDIEIDGVTISFAKGSATTNPRYWANDKGMRTYKGNVLTVTAPKGGKITSIVFTGTFSSNSAGYNSSSKTWSGSDDTVTLNITNGSNFTKIAITFDSVGACYHDDTVVPCEQRAATCEGTGISQSCYRCESCDLYFTTDACTEILENAVVDALGHTYGDWIDEVASTCAATGTKGHFHCSACGKDFDSEKAVLEDLTIAINPDNHSHLSPVAEQDPTCENAGWNAHYVCDGCSKIYETEDATAEYDPAIEALDHDLQYRANGTDKHEQYCTRGDYVGEAAEHTATTWVAATNGHHKVCTVCGLNFDEGAHSYNDGVCVCGMEDTHEHNYTDTVTKQPTCTEKGVRTYKCDGCDDTYTEDIDALGHDDYKADETAATCTDNKVEHWACHRCDRTDDQEIADTALGHDFTGDVLPITDDATHHAQKCSRCDAFDVDNSEECDYTEQTVDADGHHTTCVCGRIGSTVPHEYAAATQTCDCGKINPTYLVVVGSDSVVATFEMGTGTGSAGGSDQSKYSETANGYTLAISRESGNMYINAGDGTNNVLRLAKSGNSASLSFTVPDDVTKVVIYVARYNGSKAVQLTINGVNVDSPTSTTYIAVTVDTSSVKTILLGTDNYCYINTIEYWAVGQDHVADPDQTPSVTPADCMNAGKVSFYCTTEGCTTLHEVAIPTLAHNYGEWIDEVAATCTATGTKGHFHCNACDNDFDSAENEYALLDNLTIAINPNNHVAELTHVAAQEATTCDTTVTENAGHVEYWQCACGVMYADADRNTVIDSLEYSYLDHTPEWDNDMSTDFGHSGECSVCHEIFIDEQHVWNADNTECSVCGYEKPAGKHYVTTVIIVDGVQVDGIPAGVTLTWSPELDGNAFTGEEAFVEIILSSGYKFAEGDAITVINADGADATDLMIDGNTAMFTADDDYTVTITLVSIPTAVVNYSVENATVTVTAADGTTISSGDSVLVGTELTITVTADQGYAVKSVTVNGTAITDGKYTIAEDDRTITIAVTVEEKTAVYKKITTQAEFDSIFANSENAKILIVYGNQFVDITSAGTNTAALAGTATIDNNTIAPTADVDKYAFTVEKSGNVYKFKSASGYYMGHSGTSNNMTSSDNGSADAYNNIVVVDANGTHIVQGSTYTKGTSYEFMINGSYCRYYKGTQKTVTLYVLQ